MPFYDCTLSCFIRVKRKRKRRRKLSLHSSYKSFPRRQTFFKTFVNFFLFFLLPGCGSWGMDMLTNEYKGTVQPKKIYIQQRMFFLPFHDRSKNLSIHVLIKTFVSPSSPKSYNFSYPFLAFENVYYPSFPPKTFPHFYVIHISLYVKWRSCIVFRRITF